MLKLLKKIAVTGHIASGKSTACQYFKELGAYVVNADNLVHELLSNKISVKSQIIKLLGTDILEKKEISREKVAKKVFSNSILLEKFEKIIHPKVFIQIEKLYKQVEKTNKYIFFIVEMPLLYETKQEDFYDSTIVIVADQEKRRKRFKQDFSDREKRLIPIEQKIKKSDFVIYNNSELTEFKKQIKQTANILMHL
jgi:dephospho-CoA kinase